MQEGTGKDQSSINTETTPETSSKSESPRGSEDSKVEDLKEFSEGDVKEMFKSSVGEDSKKSKSSLELPDNGYFKRMWTTHRYGTDLRLSDKDFEIAAKYMNAINKDPKYWGENSKIEGVSKRELVVDFAGYTNYHGTTDFYLNLIKENPDLFKDIMASMLDGETKYSFDELEGLFKYKKNSQKINKALSKIKLHEVRDFFKEIAKKEIDNLRSELNDIKNNLMKIDLLEDFKKDNIGDDTNKITEFISECSLKNNTTLYKGGQIHGLLNSQNSTTNMGKKLGDAIKSYIKDNKGDSKKIKKFVNKELNGRTFVQERFISTTLKEYMAVGWATDNLTGDRTKDSSPLVFQISAPANTKAAFMETFNPQSNGLTQHYDQYEVLEQRESKISFGSKSFVGYDEKNNILTLSAKLEQKQNPTKFSENLTKIKKDFVGFLKKINPNLLVNDEIITTIKNMSQKIVEAIEGAKESIGTKEDGLSKAMGNMTIK